MVDALREARRVLTPSGVLVNVQPITAPIVMEVVIDAQAMWAKQVHSYSAPEEVAAAESAVQRALSAQWFRFDQSLSFDFEIYCDTVADLSLYVQARKLSEAEIPYKELEQRQRELVANGQTPRLRCLRPWTLSTYRRR